MNKPVIAFIIPVLHPENSKDWNMQIEYLMQTVRSISSQTSSNWRGVIIVNAGVVLPDLPTKFVVEYVNFAPNPKMERNLNSLQDFHDAIRLDKGKRVLSGVLRASDADFIMVVDDDDFIHKDVTSFVEKNHYCDGWYISKGFVWSVGSKFLYKYSDFNNICGSSLIVRTSLYSLPESLDVASEKYIKDFFGSHRFIVEYAESVRKELKPLPFFGAIYRVGHPCSHSSSLSIWRRFFFKKYLISNPKELILRIFSLTIFGRQIKNDFLGLEHYGDSQ
jgi:hypothetical protein